MSNTIELNYLLVNYWYICNVNFLIMLCIVIQDVSVDNDFVSLLHEVQKQRQIKVIHGNLLRHDEIRHGTSSWVLDTDDPVAILFEYMKQKNLRLIDLLHNLDKDNSETLSRDELHMGLSVRKDDN